MNVVALIFGALVVFVAPCLFFYLFRDFNWFFSVLCYIVTVVLALEVVILTVPSDYLANLAALQLQASALIGFLALLFAALAPIVRLGQGLLACVIKPPTLPACDWCGVVLVACLGLCCLLPLGMEQVIGRAPDETFHERIFFDERLQPLEEDIGERVKEGSWPQTCSVIKEEDIVNSQTGPGCYGWCRAELHYGLSGPKPLGSVPWPSWYLCERVYLWMVFSPAIPLPYVGFSVPVVSLLVAVAYGLLSALSGWPFSQQEHETFPSSLLHLEEQNEQKQQREVKRGAPKLEPPDRKDFDPRGPYSKLVGAYLTPFNAVEWCCARWGQNDFGAEVLNLKFARATLLVEPAQDIFSVMTLLASGQPTYAFALLAAVLLPNLTDPFQTEFTKEMNTSLEQGFATKGVFGHQLREGHFEGFMGAIVGMCALMRTPGLSLVSTASLAFGLCLSLVLSIPGAFKASHCLADWELDFGDYYAVVQRKRTCKAWRQFRRSVATMAGGSLLGLVLCSPKRLMGTLVSLTQVAGFVVYTSAIINIFCRDRLVAFASQFASFFMLSADPSGEMEPDMGSDPEGPESRLRPTEAKVNALLLDSWLLLGWALIWLKLCRANEGEWWQFWNWILRIEDASFNQQLRQMIFVTLGSLCALALPVGDMFFPPEGFDEDRYYQPGTYQLIPGSADGVEILVEPSPNSECLSKLPEGSVVQIDEVQKVETGKCCGMTRITIFGFLQEESAGSGWIDVGQNAVRVFEDPHPDNLEEKRTPRDEHK